MLTEMQERQSGYNISIQCSLAHKPHGKTSVVQIKRIPQPQHGGNKPGMIFISCHSIRAV